jgi:hypothetical protein
MAAVSTRTIDSTFRLQLVRVCRNGNAKEKLQIRTSEVHDTVSDI